MWLNYDVLFGLWAWVLKHKHLKEVNCGTISGKAIIDVKLLLVHNNNNIYRWLSCNCGKLCFLHCAKLLVHMLQYESNGLDMCGFYGILRYNTHLMWCTVRRILQSTYSRLYLVKRTPKKCSKTFKPWLFVKHVGRSLIFQRMLKLWCWQFHG